MTADPNVLLDIIESDADHIRGELSLSGICRDPKDDKFIACAVDGNADYIVSGDADLLVLAEYRGVRIVQPAEFVEILDRQTK